MTDQPMDYRDYLIRQQERIAQQFDALFTKDEDHAAAATRASKTRRPTTLRRPAAYDDAGVSDRRDHPDSRSPRIQSGIVPEKDARKLLADLGRLAKQIAKIAPTKSRHDSAQQP